MICSLVIEYFHHFSPIIISLALTLIANIVSVKLGNAMNSPCFFRLIVHSKTRCIFNYSIIIIHWSFSVSLFCSFVLWFVSFRFVFFYIQTLEQQTHRHTVAIHIQITLLYLCVSFVCHFANRIIDMDLFLLCKNTRNAMLTQARQCIDYN